MIALSLVKEFLKGYLAMFDSSTKIIAPQSSPTTHAQITGRWALISRVAWLLIALGALGMAVGGIPHRYAELLPACVAETECSITSQLTAAQQAAINQVGVTMPNYIIFFEVVAMLFVVACVVPATLIYWRRSNSLIAFVASLFLITIATQATYNGDALARAIPFFALPIRLQMGISSILATMLFYQFPNGRFVPRWTRWVVVGWSAYTLVAAFIPTLPAVINGAAPMLDQLAGILVLIGGVASQVYRYARIATLIEREQMKWIIAVIGFQLAIYILVLVVIPGLVLTKDPLMQVIEGDIRFLVYILTFLLFPAAFIFSILRYRLWDIDFIINRSLIYGALTFALLVVFIGSALILQQVFTALTGAQQAPIAVGGSMLLAGLLFNPIRARLRRFVDQRLYGIQIDYIEALKEQHNIPRPDTGNLARPASLIDYGELELIGRGGMADVYKGSHPTLKRPVAIKALRHSLAMQGGDFTKRFEREARILSTLKHPHIIQLYDYGISDDGVLYMVIEYINGKDLASALNVGEQISTSEALGIIRDIASALDHAHTQDLVHRDVKPSNIMLEPITAQGNQRRFRAVLTDFGIAKMSNATQITASNVMGTFDYIAPEQIKDTADVDGRADIYALGIVLFQMLTGHQPFTASNPAAMLIAHLNQPAPDPRDLAPHVPDNIALAIMQAMSKQPEERFATAGDMLAAMAA